MDTPRVSALFQNCNSAVFSSRANPHVTGISYDSRTVEPGFLFFAIPGVHTDGHRFIPQAINAGAAAIFHNRPQAELLDQLSSQINRARLSSVLFIQVEDVRRTMAEVSAEFYRRPQDTLSLIGVTGTDGKSTTVSLIYQLLSLLGEQAGFISTVAMGINQQLQENPLRQSTPESPEIFSLLNDMVSQGCAHAVIESTSHGLSEKTRRLHGIRFTTGVFTNISHEHLEFHGSFEQYRYDKANLFRSLGTRSRPPEPPQPADRPGSGIINAQSHHARYMAEAAGLSDPETRILFYGIHDRIPEENQDLPLSLQARVTQALPQGSWVTMAYPEAGIQQDRRLWIPLPGEFMVENTMAAVLAVHSHLAIPIGRILEEVQHLEGVKGRMRRVDEGQDFSVIIDYAHTPGSFETVFPLFRKSTEKRLLALFGSGGERDTEKRPIQGAIAGTYAEELFLTDEDPRLEDPMAIIDEIAQGARDLQTRDPRARVQHIHRIIGREAAIEQAFRSAQPGDLVVLLGKGHESSIITADGKIPWDEEAVARRILRKLMGEGT